MKFFDHCIDNTHWNVYRQLELIPDTVPDPQADAGFNFGLDRIWGKLLSLLADELVEEQQVEYLERCFALNESGQGEKSASSTLQRLWVLME